MFDRVYSLTDGSGEYCNKPLAPNTTYPNPINPYCGNVKPMTTNNANNNGIDNSWTNNKVQSRHPDVCIVKSSNLKALVLSL